MKQTESQLQRAVARVLDASGLLWCHVPNGGQRHPAVAKKLKAEGVKPGCPDVLVFEPYIVHVKVPMMKARAFTLEQLVNGDKEVTESRVCCGLALELKAGRNKPTAAQVEWHERLRKNGWRVEVCYTLDEVLGILRECYPSKFNN